MRKSVLDFICDQWTTVPPVEKVDLTGKTVIVVGGNAGIGFEATKHFASMNPQRLIIGCRSESRGQEAAKGEFSAKKRIKSMNILLADLENSTGLKGCEVWLVDLANFASVNSFAERVNNECKDLNLLVMNAGILTKKYDITVDGWEST